MTSKTQDGISSLAEVLPGSQFAEHHSGIVDAPPPVVWKALQGLRWTDLRVTRPLVSIRGLRDPGTNDRVVEAFTCRVGSLLVEEAPKFLLLVMVGKPWSLRPQRVAVTSLQDVQSYTEPGWLKYGTEWILHPLPEGRTLVETRTLCEATDSTAQRRFGLYWLGIRGASGVVRRDMIAALRRLAVHPG